MSEVTDRFAVWGRGPATASLVREGEATDAAVGAAARFGFHLHDPDAWAVEVEASEADIDAATRHDAAVLGWAPLLVNEREDTMSTDMTCTNIRETIRRINPAGVLSAGKHDADSGECCIMEALAVHMGLDWTDRPEAVGMPDIRSLNDGPWSSDEVRTEHMVRLAEALEPWASWDEEQRRAYTERVVIWTVRNLIADLPGLPDAVRERCRGAATLAEAEAAAWAAEAAARAVEAAARAAEAAAWEAWEAAAWEAWEAWDAWEAARAARAAEAAADAAADAAAWAAEASDPDATLIRAVDGWIACVSEP